MATQLEMLEKLLDEKLKGLHIEMQAEFTIVKSELSKIKDQTIKTNGRVTELEKNELHHPINCPIRVRVEDIDKDLTEYRMIKRYPKLALFVLIAVIAASMYSLYTNTTTRKIVQGIHPTTEIIKEVK